MRRPYLTGLLVLAGMAGLFGCGSAGSGGFEAGNRLIVTSVTGADDAAVPVFNAVQKTDDSGQDGQPGTNDTFEDDGTPQPLYEAILEDLSDDMGKISLQNVARLGVDPGVDLQVYRVDLTYYDANHQRHDYAPTKVYQVTETVPNNGTADLDVVLVPIEMKEDALQEIFLTGALNGVPVDVQSVRTWTVVADVYANDLLNDRTVHAQGQITVRFINPMVEQVVAP